MPPIVCNAPHAPRPAVPTQPPTIDEMLLSLCPELLKNSDDITLLSVLSATRWFPVEWLNSLLDGWTPSDVREWGNPIQVTGHEVYRYKEIRARQGHAIRLSVEVVRRIEVLRADRLERLADLRAELCDAGRRLQDERAQCLKIAGQQAERMKAANTAKAAHMAAVHKALSASPEVVTTTERLKIATGAADEAAAAVHRLSELFVEVRPLRKRWARCFPGEQMPAELEMRE